MNRLDDLHALLSENVAKVGELLHKEEEVEKKKNATVWVFAALGIVVVAAAAIYGLYRFFKPDYLEDFEDDFEDDFDDDFFEDEDEKTDESDEESADEDNDADEDAAESDADENAVTDEMTEED